MIKTGRFFDASASKADVDEAMDDMVETVATALFISWQDKLATRFRYQTGDYISGNRVEPKGSGSWSVHDDIAKPYGPWLEGAGSRNSPVTRFPGYHSLADAYEEISGRIDEYCNPPLKELVAKLNAPA